MLDVNTCEYQLVMRSYLYNYKLPLFLIQLTMQLREPATSQMSCKTLNAYENQTIFTQNMF